MTNDAQLKENRLVYYNAEAIDAVNGVLDRLLELSSARQAILVDVEGHLITTRGVTSEQLNIDNVSALVAGTFAATKATAKQLGQDEFSVLFHQGEKDSIQLTLIDDRMLLAIIFDQSTTIGMVRVYASETAARVSKIFSGQTEDAESPLTEAFSDSVQDKLDDLFES